MKEIDIVFTVVTDVEGATKLSVQNALDALIGRHQEEFEQDIQEYSDGDKL